MATSQLFVELRVKHELNVCTTMRIKKGLSKGVAKKKKGKNERAERGRNTHTWHIGINAKCNFLLMG